MRKPAYPRHYPRHYIPEDNVTIEWLQTGDEVAPLSTVQEFNAWPGKPDLPEKEGDTLTATRHVVLMETDHDAILRINKLLIEGSPHALRALRVATCMYGVPKHGQVLLGYDFKNNCPRVIITGF